LLSRRGSSNFLLRQTRIPFDIKRIAHNSTQSGVATVRSEYVWTPQFRMNKEMNSRKIPQASVNLPLTEQEDCCIHNNEKNFQKYYESVRPQVMNYKLILQFPIGLVWVLQTTEVLGRFIQYLR
jgi:hypothetical protein